MPDDWWNAHLRAVWSEAGTLTVCLFPLGHRTDLSAGLTDMRLADRMSTKERLGTSVGYMPRVIAHVS